MQTSDSKSLKTVNPGTLFPHSHDSSFVRQLAVKYAHVSVCKCAIWNLNTHAHTKRLVSYYSNDITRVSRARLPGVTAWHFSRYKQTCRKPNCEEHRVSVVLFNSGSYSCLQRDHNYYKGVTCFITKPHLMRNRHNALVLFELAG